MKQPNLKNSNSYLFIVGSPRSGTTILGDILNLHSEIIQWYEPYFIWDKFFRTASDDHRKEEDATPEVISYISFHFSRYLRPSNRRFLIDKSPRNSLKIPFIREIFPNARFIHILRDGRDVTLSIYKEWLRRIQIFEGKRKKPKFNYSEAGQVIARWLNRQPFIFDKVRALWHETHFHFFDKKKHLNRLRWNDRIGWGPRFKNWEEALNSQSLIQFCALQWSYCVKSVVDEWGNIPSDNKLEIHYEEFIQRPLDTLNQVLKFIEVNDDPHLFDKMPPIKKNNFNKWEKALSPYQINQIQPILTPMLKRFGYVE